VGVAVAMSEVAVAGAAGAAAFVGFAAFAVLAAAIRVGVLTQASLARRCIGPTNGRAKRMLR
jgi:hypothetical protein